MLKGERSKGFKTVEALLSVGEATLVLVILGETLFLFIDPVEGGEREEEFVFLTLVKCVWEAVTVLLNLGDEFEDW